MAVCIVGTVRTFHYKSVHTNILNNIIKPLRSKHETDIFFIISMNDDVGSIANSVKAEEKLTRKAILKFNPTKIIEYDSLDLHNDDQLFNRSRYIAKLGLTPVMMQSPHWCKNDPIKTLDFSHTLLRTKQCLHVVKEYETEKSISYQWLYRTRPDLAISKTITTPDMMDENTLYTTTSPWNEPFEKWWPSWKQTNEIGNGPIGDQLFASSRAVAEIAFRAFDIIDDCEVYEMPSANVESSLRLWLVKHSITYKLTSWIFMIVRGDAQPICQAIEVYDIPGTTPQDRKSWCLKFVKDSNGEVKGF